MWVCLAVCSGAVLTVAAEPSNGSEPVATKPAQDELGRIDQRFSNETAEVPEFRKHVVPLLGRLGCNGRACHGSFQGQGGFRLSLFGYDFPADHENLVKGDHPRTNLESPPSSLFLQKGTLSEPHEGGQRFTTDSWQYRVLMGWVKAGAQGVSKVTPEFVRLDVTPAEMVARQPGDTWQLKAIAVWSDGSREDVTPLCRFQTNNEQIADVTEEGLVAAKEPGDSHVVVFYDNGVHPVPVLHPVSKSIGPDYPPVPTPTTIDVLVVEKLQKLGIVPSGLCTDHEFLRRVSLDLTGTLPTMDEVQAFLADSTEDKRRRKIDELLSRPTYAAWWSTKLADFTGNNAKYLNQQNLIRGQTAASEWYEWLRTRVEQNMPYDQIVEGIVLAETRLDGESYAEMCDRLSGYYQKEPKGSYAEQPSLTHYWSRNNFRTTEERALGFAYTFLGVRIQCAQCHKHPFDQWTKDDFDRFKLFFGRVNYGTAPEAKEDEAKRFAELGIDPKKINNNQLSDRLREEVRQGKTVPFRELYLVPAKVLTPEQLAKMKKNGKENKKRAAVVAGRTAQVLGGDELKIDHLADPRTALIDWLRDEENPYFAQAFVNRVWAGYFHRGIVEPADDLSLANPPSHPELLNYLAKGLREHGFDMKWVHREICNSRTYQLSWEQNETNRLDERNFSRAVPRRLPAEVIYDALRVATASDPEAAKLVQTAEGRAIADSTVGAKGDRSGYALTVFGRSIRESNCDCDRSTEPSLLQTVFLQNDQELLSLIDRKGGWVDQIVKTVMKTPDGAAASKTDPKTKPSEAPVSSPEKPKKNKAPSADGTGEPDANPLAAAERQVTQLRRRVERIKASDQPERAERLKRAQADLATAEKRAASLRTVKPGETVSNATATPTTDVKAALPTIIRSAYLRTVGRPPTDAETARALRYYEETSDLKIGTRDLLWALLNTKEFVVNH
jgi:hypothetical protein